MAAPRWLPDILKQGSPIDLSILLAVFAAIYSAATRKKGSLANDIALAGVHWLVALLLATSKWKPTYVVLCDVELTWLLYGVLFGEMELDATPAFITTMLSAYLYKIHMRNKRVDDSLIASAALNDDDGRTDA